MRDDNFQLLRLMVAIIQEPRVEQHVHFYPDSRPVRMFTATGVEYGCEWCGQDLTQSVHLQFLIIAMLTSNSMTPSYRPNHLHTCHREAVKRHAGQTPQYCHRCNIWFPEPSEYREHCRRHFMELDMFCGLVKEKQTIIVPARCPFCLSKSELDQEWEQRLVEFSNYPALDRHLEHDHPDELNNCRCCPHPLCGSYEIESRNYLLGHFTEAHGIHHEGIQKLYDQTKKMSSPQSPADDGSSCIDCHLIKHPDEQDWTTKSPDDDSFGIDPALPSYTNCDDRFHLHQPENLQCQTTMDWSPNSLVDDVPLCSDPRQFSDVGVNGGDSPISSSSSLLSSAPSSPTDYTSLGSCLPFEPDLPTAARIDLAALSTDKEQLGRIDGRRRFSRRPQRCR